MSGAPEQVYSSKNAGVSVTWTADGKVLFVDSTRIDAATGEAVDSLPEDAEPQMRQVRSAAAVGSDV